MAGLEIEPLGLGIWKTRKDLHLEIFDRVEAFYNRRRKYTVFGYMIPRYYEERRIEETLSRQAATNE